MVKVKKETPEVTEKDLIKEYGEDAAADIIAEREEASKKEGKSKVVPSKETICEYYWIRDEEVLDSNFDLSKYWINKWEEAVLKEWAEEKTKKELKEVTMDKLELEWHPNVDVIVEKYWVQPQHIIENKLWDLWLSKDEEKIVKSFYENEMLRLYKKANNIEY